MAKGVGVGNAARNGLLAALLAQQGFDGPAAPLEGQRGFLRVAAEQPDLSAVTPGLGRHWQLADNTSKPYPCGRVLTPFIDACPEIAAHPRLRHPGLTGTQREARRLSGGGE